LTPSVSPPARNVSPANFCTLPAQLRDGSKVTAL